MAEPRRRADGLAEPGKLPVGPVGRHGIGFWGVGTLVATEAALFSTCCSPTTTPERPRSPAGCWSHTRR